MENNNWKIKQLADAAIDKKLMQDMGILIKYNTCEEIRIALGLKPWDEFAIESIQWFLGDSLKYEGAARTLEYIYSKVRTGRTTRMLVEAVYTSQMKPVNISSWSKSYTEVLVCKAKEYCVQLGLKPDNINPGTEENPGYIDHYRGNK